MIAKQPTRAWYFYLFLAFAILASNLGSISVSAQAGFPSTGILDNFDRANGLPGGNWTGVTSGYSIAANRLDVGTGDGLFFNTQYGPDQEAFVTFSTIDPASTQQALLLKAQSTSSLTAGVMAVIYDAVNHRVQVYTYSSAQGFVKRGADIPVTLANGDQLGARANQAGIVDVYRNGTLIGSRTSTAWTYTANGGYTGLWFIGAGNALLDDFGGGSVSTTPINTPTSTSTTTPTFTPTNTSVFTPTDTPIFTPTETSTFTPTSTSTSTPLPTFTFTPTNTFTPAPTGTPDVYRVSAGGSTNLTCGTTWADPCDLQNALSLASAGDEIWVMQGVYKPGNDRDSAFQLKSGVAVYGGFTGAEIARNQRNIDPSTNGTVLSGDIGVAANASDNVYHVVTANFVASTAILDGFTITSGNADSATGNFGGGLYSENGSPTLTNIIFSNNLSNAAGGGMFVITNNQTLRANYTTPTLTRVIFSENIAARGGGLFTQNSNPTLVDVIFTGNVANNGAGGGMNNQVLNEATDEYSIPILTNVTFSGNDANGGGGLFNNHSYPVLTNVTFSGNTANIRGGAILNEGANPVLKNVTITGNTAPEGFGGSIRNVQNASLASSNPQIYNSILWGNGSEEITSDGTGSTTIVDSVVQGGFPGTNLITTDPNLAPLANSGGFTETHALGAVSSALDAGGVNNPCATTDQRGVTRPQGSGCDMGAYEVEGGLPTTPTHTPTEPPTASSTPTSTPFPGNTATATNTLLPSNTPTPTATASSLITIGETNVLSMSYSGLGNRLVAQQVTLPESATIQSLSYYVATAGGQLRLGIYNNSGNAPGTLVAQTAAFTPVAGWNTQTVLTPSLLPAGTYWLAFLPQNNGLAGRVVPSGAGRHYSYTFGTLPGTFSSSSTSGAFHFSFYATLSR